MVIIPKVFFFFFKFLLIIIILKSHYSDFFFIPKGHNSEGFSFRMIIIPNGNCFERIHFRRVIIPKRMSWSSLLWTVFIPKEYNLLEYKTFVIMTFRNRI